jgi:hypothetical protein
MKLSYVPYVPARIEIRSDGPMWFSLNFKLFVPYVPMWFS